MPIQTDLSQSPYFDDYNSEKNYQKILFKPSTPVQVRELNQLQSILQDQIEKFGDNIYQRGTIIDGCNFIFHNKLDYIRILDTEPDTTPILIEQYKGKMIVDPATGLKARIIDIADGYQTSYPNMKTLFIKYIDGGDGSKNLFEADDNLNVFTSGNIIQDIDIFSGSAGFSNNDLAVITSAIEVVDSKGLQQFQNTSGQACTFVVGETIKIDRVAGPQFKIHEILENEYGTVLRIKPLASQLKIANTQSWDSLLPTDVFTSQTSKIRGGVKRIIGAGAQLALITNQQGSILTCPIVNKGSGYDVVPYVSIMYKEANANADDNLFDTLNIVAKTYISTVTVHDAVDSIGEGMAFSVGPGVIYQRGHFLETKGDFVIVSKYSTDSNNVVGFDVSESIVTAAGDLSLYDNALGAPNYNAPGADRLKMDPKLKVLTKDQADANSSFFPLVEYSEGRPYKQNPYTKFKAVDDEMARRTYDESGDYVLDPFLVDVTHANKLDDEPSYLRLTIDPGKAYVNGRRVQTRKTAAVEILKGIDTSTQDTAISLDFGNYFRVNEFAGIFNFRKGSVIHCFNQPMNYLTNDITINTNTLGDINTYIAARQGNPTNAQYMYRGRIRSVTLESGIPGTPTAIYRLYVYDINTNFSSLVGGSIESIQGNGSTVTVTTTTPHGLTSLSDTIYIVRNSDGYDTAPGEYPTVTVIDDYTFTYAGTTTILSAGGDARKRITGEDTQFTFRDISSIAYYDTAAQEYKGVADVIKEPGIPLLYDGANKNSLVFPSGNRALKSISNLKYTYRSDFNDIGISGTTVSVKLDRSVDYFDYQATLSDTEKLTTILIPESNFYAANPISDIYSGTTYEEAVGGDTADNRITVTGTGNLLSISAGDYIKITDSNNGEDVVRVTSLVNSKKIIFVPALTNVNLGSYNLSAITHAYPAGLPIPFTNIGGSTNAVRNNRSISVTGSANNTLVFDLGHTVTGSPSFTAIADVKSSQNAVQKLVKRKQYTKIGPINSTEPGPWILRYSDIIKLTGVYQIEDARQFLLNSDGTANTTGDGTTTTITAAGHNFEVGNIVKFTGTPLTQLNGQYLTVQSVATDTFTVNTTYNNSTGVTGSGYVQRQVTPNDEKVSNYFWIDHNQYKNAVPFSKLYKTKNHTFQDKTYLLVEFDALDSQSNGPKTVNSYPINDSIEYKYAATSMHTVEIPELISNQGRVYDLRDCLDFRPIVENAAFTSNHLDAILNPYSPGHNTENKYFPSPGSEANFTAEYYLGRKDTIAITSTGDFKIIKGTPSKNPKPPQMQKNALFITNVSIPPYPSIAPRRSTAIGRYMSGRSRNKGRLGNLKDQFFTAGLLKGRNRMALPQTKGYTMSDIAALDRRLTDLEYYVALTFAENEVNALQIPSGIDGTDRFKFGFFVDNFTTVNFSDTFNQEYRAQIFDFRVHPKKRNVQIKYKFNTFDAVTNSAIIKGKVIIPFEIAPKKITQTQATESDYVYIYTTNKVIRTDTEEIKEYTTTVQQVTKTEWEEIQAGSGASVPVVYIKDNGSKIIPYRQFDRCANLSSLYELDGASVLAQFVAGKLPGTITAYGVVGPSAEGAAQGLCPSLQYLNSTTGKWVDLLNFSILEYNGAQGLFWDGSNWRISIPWNGKFANETGDVHYQLFRIVLGNVSTQTSKDSSLPISIDGGSYPSSEDAVRYQSQNITQDSIAEITTVNTTEEIVENSSTLVKDEVTEIIDPLFNSNRTALVQIANLFDQPPGVVSPFIDLAQYIYSDLNDNPDAKIYTDTETRTVLSTG